MRNDYVVYIHKNILNGKVYVGQTCNLSERWRNNGKNYFNSIKFYNAIKKYGWDNFTHEVVYSNLNKQAADKLEKELIHKYNSIEEGYNLKEGGSRGELSTKSLAKMSESLKRGSSIVHEAEHIKNHIWQYIGYTPQRDNDEVDAYLLTYIYDKITQVFYKHKDNKE